MPERHTRERVLVAQLPVMETPEIAGRLRAWADVRNKSIADVLREVVRAGLASLEPSWIAQQGGELNPKFLERHVTNSVKRDKA